MCIKIIAMLKTNVILSRESKQRQHKETHYDILDQSEVQHTYLSDSPDENQLLFTSVQVKTQAMGFNLEITFGSP